MIAWRDRNRNGGFHGSPERGYKNPAGYKWVMPEPVVAHTKHGDLTVDQLAEVQPGLARLMDELARYFYYLFYAAKGGNWELARLQHGSVLAVFRTAKTLRPKYAADMTVFEQECMQPIADAIGRKDWAAFEQAYQRAIEGSDRYHDKYGFSYIRYVLPPSPPAHLDLNPPERRVRRKA